MKAMCSHIIIGEYEFDYVHSVRVQSSWKTLTDTCTIEMPNVQGFREKVRPGQEVIVQLGYDGLLVEEFRGYVSAVSPRSPLTIECQDEMWQLRQQTVSHSWRSVQLREVLQYLVPQAVLTSVPHITLAPFRLDKVTKAEALEVLKEQYGIAVFFRGPELYAGLPYGIDEEPLRWRYHMQQNVASFGSLEYRRAEDVKVKLKAISIRPDNSRVEVDLGDTDGEQHTLHFYNLTRPELEAQAKEKMALMKFDGYKGAFVAYGQPNPQHSGIVELEDGKYADRGGHYFIDDVMTDYSPNGYRKEITLGKMAA